MSTRMPKPVRVATRQADGRLVYAHGQAPVTPCRAVTGMWWKRRTTRVVPWWNVTVATHGTRDDCGGGGASGAGHRGGGSLRCWLPGEVGDGASCSQWALHPPHVLSRLHDQPYVCPFDVHAGDNRCLTARAGRFIGIASTAGSSDFWESHPSYIHGMVIGSNEASRAVHGEGGAYPGGLQRYPLTVWNLELKKEAYASFFLMCRANESPTLYRFEEVGLRCGR